MTEKISVIIPVYKVEKYLDNCIKSIVAQTYRNLEIILVDDGSPDNCPAMCDAWAKKDNRIKVIHKENGGLSDARNVGMAAATGDFIGFVDSDDWISPDMYQLLYDRMKIDGSDIVACGVQMVWEDYTPPRILTKSGCRVMNSQEAMQAIIEESWLKQPVWYKLYKTELVQDIPFPVGKYHEDVFWSYQAVGRANKISVIDTPCYFYTQRSGSIMGEGYSLRRLDSLDAKLLRLAYIQEHFSQLVSLAQCDLLFSCMYAMQMCLQYVPKPELRIARKKIKDTVNAIRPFPYASNFSIKQKFWILMSSFSFEAICRVRNMLKVGV